MHGCTDEMTSVTCCAVSETAVKRHLPSRTLEPTLPLALLMYVSKTGLVECWWWGGGALARPTPSIAVMIAA